jgi:hypothetical protein
MNTLQLDFGYPALDGDRDGETFDPFLDTTRLNAQMRRVFHQMRGSGWYTLSQISESTGDPEASVSARLRDLRKPRFGGLVVNRRRVGAGYEYQVKQTEA